jgi:hypothetical protein
LQGRDVTFTVARRLLGIERNGNRLMARIGTDYSDLVTRADYDQVVVNYGTMPIDDLYFDLKPMSRNLGTLDYEAFIQGQPQTIVKNETATFDLYRIGDAVSSRNTHAAIYDALRLMAQI